MIKEIFRMLIQQNIHCFWVKKEAILLSKGQMDGGMTDLGTQKEKHILHRKILGPTLDILSFMRDQVALDR